MFYDLIHNSNTTKYNLSMVTEQHSYLTRSATNEELSIEHYRTNLRKFCPTVIGKYFWNNIPLSIRSKSPKKVFKKYLQRFFLAQY